jgi:hypothetical protein
MIAIDTNLLVYAHRPESPFHAPAAALVHGLANGPARWAIPWPCVHEFLSITTHLRIYREPTPLARALEAIRTLQLSPTLELLAEGEAYLDRLADLAQAAHIQGPRIHDARIAALCRYHGVSELWSADRDFNRYTGIKVRNPLL